MPESVSPRGVLNLQVKMWSVKRSSLNQALLKLALVQLILQRLTTFYPDTTLGDEIVSLALVSACYGNYLASRSLILCDGHFRTDAVVLKLDHM